MTSIESFAFNLCSNLTSVTLPINNNFTAIQDAAFQFCASLTNITIPSSVTSIGDFAFYICTALTSITIPNSVTSIGTRTFDSSSLTRVNFLGNAPSLGSVPFNDTDANLKIYRYSTKSGWSSTFGGKDVLLIDAPSKGLRTFGFNGISSGKTSIKKQNLGGGKIQLYKFLPNRLQGLSLWLKADSGVTLDGSNVTAWADQSENGKNATTENGGADSPIFVSSAQNSNPAIQFNNSALDGASFMRIASPAFNLKNSTAFFVAKQLNQIIFARLFSFLSASGADYNTNDGLAVLYNNTTDPRQFQIENNSGNAFENASNYEAFGVASYTITSGGLITPFFNSIAGTTHTNADMASTNGADALIAQGSQFLGGSSLDGQIAEIVIYSRVLTTPERQQVEAYLNEKYAIY